MNTVNSIVLEFVQGRWIKEPRCLDLSKSYEIFAELSKTFPYQCVAHPKGGCGQRVESRCVLVWIVTVKILARWLQQNTVLLSLKEAENEIFNLLLFVCSMLLLLLLLLLPLLLTVLLFIFGFL